MARKGVRLNRKGVSKTLKSPEFKAKMDALANRIAQEIGEEAKVDSYTTDRGAASVSVPADMQARDGALTRGAAAAGLEVRVK